MKFPRLDKVESSHKLSVMKIMVDEMREILTEGREFSKCEKLAEEICIDFLRTGLFPRGQDELPVVILPDLFSLILQVNELINGHPAKTEA